jgi:hypothetical protein
MPDMIIIKYFSAAPPFRDGIMAIIYPGLYPEICEFIK